MLVDIFCTLSCCKSVFYFENIVRKVLWFLREEVNSNSDTRNENFGGFSIRKLSELESPCARGDSLFGVMDKRGVLFLPPGGMLQKYSVHFADHLCRIESSPPRKNTIGAVHPV